MGANIGIGGHVIGDCLECPFHGWQFRGSDGKVTKIPYSENSKCKITQPLHLGPDSESFLNIKVDLNLRSKISAVNKSLQIKLILFFLIRME